MKSSKLLLMFPSWALGWDSSIVYHDSNNRLVYVSDGEGNRIVDFSHAGYKGGTVDLPQMDVKVTISHVSGDNTANIQDAIDTVAALTPNASGHRGAVLLQKGTYRVSGVIYIHTSGVVLRGEGQDNTGTVIVGTGTDQMIGLGVVVVKSSILSEPIEPSTTQQITSEIVPVGSRTFEVENGSMYSIGDRLIIQHPATDAWLAAIRYGDTAGDSVPWVPFQGDLTMKFEGMVTAIVGNKVKLDSPIYSEPGARCHKPRCPGIRVSESSPNAVSRIFEWSARMRRQQTPRMSLTVVIAYISSTSETAGQSVSQQQALFSRVSKSLTPSVQPFLTFLR